MSAELLSAIDEFAASVASRVFDEGQGYLQHRTSEGSLEVVWYRERDDEWTLSLSLESADRRVETPSNTGFTRMPRADQRQCVDALRMQLTAQWRSMLAAS